MTEPATPAPQATPSAATRNPATMLLGLIAGAVLIVGALFLDWVSGAPSKGTEAGVNIFWSASPTPEPNFFASAAFVILLIGLITLVGAALGRGGWIVLGGILAVIAYVLAVISFFRADLGLGDVGLGLWAVLVGGVLALVAGMMSRNTA
jgi:hypothetical protein